MKKKKRTVASKHIHKVTRHNTVRRPFIPSTGIITISIGVAALVAVFIVFNKQTVRHSVEGIAIMRGMFAESTVQLPQVPGGVLFNIYYKESSEPTFIHAARNIPSTNTTYTIQYLKRGATYQYKISAINAQGSEIWWSPITPMTNIQTM